MPLHFRLKVFGTWYLTIDISALEQYLREDCNLDDVIWNFGHMPFFPGSFATKVCPQPYSTAHAWSVQYILPKQCNYVNKLSGTLVNQTWEIDLFNTRSLPPFSLPHFWIPEDIALVLVSWFLNKASVKQDVTIIILNLFCLYISIYIIISRSLLYRYIIIANIHKWKLRATYPSTVVSWANQRSIPQESHA